MTVRRADRAGDETRLVGRAEVPLVAGFASQFAGGQVQVADVMAEAEVVHRDVRGTERVRLDDVGAGGEILIVDVENRLRLRDAEDIDEVLDVLGGVRESGPAVFGLAEVQPVDHRPHRAVEHEDPLAEQLVDRRLCLPRIVNRHAGFSVGKLYLSITSVD